MTMYGFAIQDQGSIVSGYLKKRVHSEMLVLYKSSVGRFLKGSWKRS
jgi:hypothetical protein